MANDTQERTGRTFAHLLMPSLRDAAEAASEKVVAIVHEGLPMLVTLQVANELEIAGVEFAYICRVNTVAGKRICLVPFKEVQ